MILANSKKKNIYIANAGRGAGTKTYPLGFSILDLIRSNLSILNETSQIARLRALYEGSAIKTKKKEIYEGPKRRTWNFIRNKRLNRSNIKRSFSDC